ncbi:MAG TPA: YggT family protein, partial [Ignavibacteriaceae bacterium]
MATKTTTIEEKDNPEEPRVVKTTQTVVNPDIHTQVVEDNNITVDSASPSVRQTRVIHEPLVKTEHQQQIYETKKSIFRVSQVIWTILAIILILLAFRVVLRVLGADPTSGFATLIYTISYPFAAPFSGIIPTDYGTGDSVFEWSTIIAAAVYVI